jgi:hypothetical protein
MEVHVLAAVLPSLNAYIARMELSATNAKADIISTT